MKSAGGIIGGTAAAGDTVVNCYNGGAITATGDGAIAAGIYGYNNSTSPVKACFNDGAITANKGTVYQIGLSNYWYDQATGSKNVSCFYKDGDKIYAAAANGADAGVEQQDMTREQLAETLNTAGQVDNFWQAQNGSVQPDPLIPGAADGEQAVANAVIEVLDEKGNVVERYESVSAAFVAAKDGQTIKLVKDADILSSSSAVELPAGFEAALDLNGHALKVANTQNGGIVVKGDLTLVDSSDTKKDGTGTGRVYTKTEYVGGATGYGMIRVFGGGSFTMESGRVDAASFTENNADKGQSAVVLENATGDASVTINGGKVIAGWYAVAGNGNNKTHEGRITVNGGKLVSEGTGTTGTWGDGTSGSGNATVNFAGKYGAVDAEISGGSFVAKNNAEMFYKGESNPVNASVSGGSFSDKVPEDMLAEGYGNNLEKGEDGLYHVHKHVWADKFESDANGHWHVCSKCNEKSEVVAHVEKTVGAKPATCGEDGYTGDVACADCGHVIRKGAVIPATGKHTAGDAWKTDGTSHWHECTGCGEKLDEAKHVGSKWTANSTDHWHLCDVCGAAHDVAAHDFGDWKVTKEATATEAGSREHVCKTCGRVVEEVIPALGSGSTGKGDKLAQTGDASLVGAAMTGIAGISAALAGVFTSRRRKEE